MQSTKQLKILAANSKVNKILAIIREKMADKNYQRHAELTILYFLYIARCQTEKHQKQLIDFFAAKINKYFTETLQKSDSRCYEEKMAYAVKNYLKTLLTYDKNLMDDLMNTAIKLSIAHDIIFDSKLPEVILKDFKPRGELDEIYNRLNESGPHLNRAITTFKEEHQSATRLKNVTDIVTIPIVFALSASLILNLYIAYLDYIDNIDINYDKSILIFRVASIGILLWGQQYVNRDIEYSRNTLRKKLDEYKTNIKLLDIETIFKSLYEDTYYEDKIESPANGNLDLQPAHSPIQTRATHFDNNVDYHTDDMIGKTTDSQDKIRPKKTSSNNNNSSNSNNNNNNNNHSPQVTNTSSGLFPREPSRTRTDVWILDNGKEVTLETIQCKSFFQRMYFDPDIESIDRNKSKEVENAIRNSDNNFHPLKSDLYSIGSRTRDFRVLGTAVGYLKSNPKVQLMYFWLPAKDHPALTALANIDKSTVSRIRYHVFNKYPLEATSTATQSPSSGSASI